MIRHRVVIVEDEALARGVVRSLLAKDAEVELVGEASDGASGLDLLRRTRPDIALLDVEMPELGGVELAAALDPEERPTIVFVTAYSRFATDAFEIEALDYIVKPFADARFFEALQRAKTRVRERRMAGLAERVAAEASRMTDPSAESEPAQPIAIPKDGRTLLVKPTEVTWIESRDYYSLIHSDQGSHLVRTSLTAFEETLDPKRFLRVHRSAIVNLDRVAEIQTLSRGARVLKLTNGARCRVSRSKRSEVERRLGC